MSPPLSLIIPTYNRPRLLRETLSDILAQDYAGAWEILVVDQSETPAAGLGRRVRVLAAQPPHLTRARNLGIRAARGEILVFVDDDVAVPSHFLSAHAAAYSSAEIGAVAGRVILSPYPPHPPSHALPPTGLDFDRTGPGYFPFARGCNMSFRRSALLAAGLFDERFSPAGYGEEEDLCFAVRYRAWRIWFEPQAWLIHLVSPQGGARAIVSAPQDHAPFYKDKTYFALKNVGGPDLWRVLWDTYRHALPPRARGLQLARRHLVWLRGSVAGAALFLSSHASHRGLPYRLPPVTPRA